MKHSLIPISICKERKKKTNKSEWLYEHRFGIYLDVRNPIFFHACVEICFRFHFKFFHIRSRISHTCVAERGHGLGMVVTRISLHRLIAFHGNLFRPRMHFYTVHSSFEISFFRSIPRNSIIFTLPPSMFTSSILPLLFPLLKVSLKSDNETVFVHGVRE